MFELTRPRRGLHRQVVDEIGLQIIGGKLKAGDTLPSADDLSHELGVSRTVTREAIKVLEEKGLLTSRPKVGTQVQPPERWKWLDLDVLEWQSQVSHRANFVQHLLEVRALIEPAAAELAAQRATEQELEEMQAAFERLSASTDNLEAYKEADRVFHSLIFRASGNPLLAYLANTINLDLDAGRDVTARAPHSLRDSLPAHAKLLQALRQRDAHLASVCARLLVAQIKDFVEEVLGTQGK